MSSVVLAIPAKGGLLSQPNKDSQITLNEVFLIKNSLAAAEIHPAQTNETPPIATGETSDGGSSAMGIFMDGIDALDMARL